MITDPQEQNVISSLGWADQGSLWVYDVGTQRQHKHKLSDASYLSIRPGRDRYFAIVHHFDSGQVRVSAHNFDNPTVALGQFQFFGPDRSFEGPLDPWQFLPAHYVSYLEQPDWNDYALISLDGEGGLSLQHFDWFDDSYDKGYQGIVGVVDVPNSENVIVSVQRSSRLILYSPVSRQAIRGIDLAGSRGNPRLQFSLNAEVLWADDYDTLLQLDPNNWEIRSQRKLQEAVRGAAQFIGNFSLNTDETLCAVPRPFSGDVLAVDPDDLGTRYHAELGRQPLEATILRDGRVVARDWQTGTLLEGQMW